MKMAREERKNRRPKTNERKRNKCSISRVIFKVKLPRNVFFSRSYSSSLSYRSHEKKINNNKLTDWPYHIVTFIVAVGVAVVTCYDDDEEL